MTQSTRAAGTNPTRWTNGCAGRRRRATTWPLRTSRISRPTSPAPAAVDPVATAGIVMKPVEQPTGSSVLTPTVGEHSATNGELKDLVDALEAGRNADAVALYLSTRVQAAVPRTNQFLADLEGVIGRPAVQRLVIAFATFRCLYCYRGFSRCERCQGSGHAELRSDACLSCLGLGAGTCDFCGGSGLVTYNFAPAGLRPAIASVRTQSAVRQVEKWRGQPTAPASSLAPRAARRLIVDQLTTTSRAVAILRNAAELSRGLRRTNAAATRLTNELFTRSTRTARRAQVRLAMLYQRLAELSRMVADGESNDQVKAFERDRAELFERESRRLANGARRRTTLVTGRELAQTGLPRHRECNLSRAGLASLHDRGQFYGDVMRGNG